MKSAIEAALAEVAATRQERDLMRIELAHAKDAQEKLRAELEETREALERTRHRLVGMHLAFLAKVD